LANLEKDMNYAKPLAVVASLTLAACNGTPREVEENTGTTQESAILANAILANAILANAILANAILANAILANDLSSNAILANGLLPGALQDPNAREFLEYTVGCALTTEQSVSFKVDGVEYTYQGELGLAPQWGEPGGSCDGRCQEWVSACLLARVDYTGVRRDISLRGDDRVLAITPSEAQAYTVREASYFGNLFTAPQPQQRFACLPPGQDEILRVCGPSLEGCIVDVDPNLHCGDLCGAQTADGAYTNCGPFRKGEGGPTYHGTITVYLKPGEL